MENQGVGIFPIEQITDDVKLPKETLMSTLDPECP